MLQPLLAPLLTAMLVTGSDAPWHQDGWRQRAIVDIPKSSSGVDTAAVRVLCQGHAHADGRDYRVVDAGGNAL